MHDLVFSMQAPPRTCIKSDKEEIQFLVCRVCRSQLLASGVWGSGLKVWGSGFRLALTVRFVPSWLDSSLAIPGQSSPRARPPRVAPWSSGAQPAVQCSGLRVWGLILRDSTLIQGKLCFNLAVKSTAQVTCYY